ncbi:hypothetical protein ACIQI7_14280 [Kitasatospora sp. NPDC092039]|uniref:hypothetical protein n=1 Tax=Kitasatospora sp. NPDC092039 TaxID=3364086 RepID=UPI0038301BAF
MSQTASAASLTVYTYPTQYGHATYNTTSGKLVAYDDLADSRRIVAILRNDAGDQLAFSEDANGTNSTPGTTDYYFGSVGEAVTLYVCRQNGTDAGNRDKCDHNTIII